MCLPGPACLVKERSKKKTPNHTVYHTKSGVCAIRSFSKRNIDKHGDF